MTRAIATGIFAAIAAGMLMAAEPVVLDHVEALPLTSVAVPLDPTDLSRTRVGRLEYRGGLALRSPNGFFGGVSALRAGPGGQLLGVEDTGAWVSFGTVERRGRLVGVTSGFIAPIRDETGAVTQSKSDVDAEGLDWDPATGEALVSLEQDHRVMVFRGIDPARPASLDGRAAATVRNPGTASWPRNSGGEAIVRLTGGDRLIFAEGDQDTPVSEVLRIGPAGTSVIHYTPPEGYRPTDAVEIAPGQLLVLNRRFTLTGGMSAVLVTVPVGPDMRGTEVARLVPPLTIDNMEGMAMVRDHGRVFVYLVSDDNFMSFQRTLLLKFELMPEGSRR